LYDSLHKASRIVKSPINSEVAEHTIRKYLWRIFGKLGVSSRVELFLSSVGGSGATRILGLRIIYSCLEPQHCAQQQRLFELVQESVSGSRARCWDELGPSLVPEEGQLLAPGSFGTPRAHIRESAPCPLTIPTRDPLCLLRRVGLPTASPRGKKPFKLGAGLIFTRS
jgi:hypothetical protein